MAHNGKRAFWQALFTKLTRVDTDDPALKRKGQLLALFLGLCWGLSTYSLINTVIVYLIQPTAEYRLYIIETLFGYIPLHVLWLMNSKGKVLLTANLAISLVILASLVLGDARYIEYLMIVFALPVGMSSFIIRPTSSFWFAGLTAAGYTVSSFVTNYSWEYNLTAIVALFALAFMTWATASQLEHTLSQNDKLLDKLKKSNDEIQTAYQTTLEGWSRALEIRDRETQGHTKRVTDLTLRIARQMGFDDESLNHVHRGVLLHDIGKLGIPDDILRKPGSLTEKETRIMRLHPQIAYELLKPIEYLKASLNIPRYHHEKWDGTGYPFGLMGESIPLEARIFAVVDVFDALTHDRVYRKAMKTVEAVAYIKSEAGSHFDPDVVAVFAREVSIYEN